MAVPLPRPARDHLADAIRELRLMVSDYLSASAASIRARSVPPSLEPLDKATATFRGAMDRLRELGALSGLDVDDVERVFSLAFAINQTVPIWPISGHAKPSTTNQA